MFSRKSLITILGAILAFGTVAVAQQTQTQSPDAGAQFRRRSERLAERGERRGRHEGMRHRGGIGHLIRELNLTDTQREQARAIMQRRLQGTTTQREELFKLREKRIAGTADDEVRAKALRQEMRASMEGVRAEMEGVLTGEQKTKLEQLQQERKEKFEQRMKERHEFQNKNPQ